MVDAIVASFRDAKAHVGRPDDGERISFAVRAGTPQGSPLSGSLFSLATILLVEELCAILGGDSVYFFADDAAVLVQRMDQMPALYEVFQRFSAASGLVLKATKCKLIPLRRHDCDERTNIRRYEEMLHELTPGWAGFQVVSDATYLGFRMGPSATDDIKWAGPVAKFSERALQMSRSHAAPSTALRHYSMYVQPVLSYVAQMVPVSRVVRHAYDVAAQRLLHMPHKALPAKFGHLLGSVGLQPMASSDEFCAGAKRRAADRLEPEVRECARRLEAARSAVGTLATLADGAKRPDEEWWACTAWADALQAARAQSADGGVASERAPLREPGRRALSDRLSACQVLEATEALRPRLRAWISAHALPDALAVRAMSRTHKITSQCAPAFGTALLRSWCRAWSTHFRRGLGGAPCPVCLRPDADRIEHLLRCAVLWRCVTDVTQI